MKLKTCVFLIAALSLFIHTQAQKIDSLKALLPNTTGTVRADVLIELARENINIDYKVSNRYALEAMSIAKHLNDSVRIVLSGRLLATTMRKLDMLDSSINLYRRIIPIARKKKLSNELKRSANSLGISYLMKARYDSALKYFFESRI
ncbi:hypothetical protein [Chryseosolibacter indicus]|uniref:Tetratricopeptide repeat protein n=1 Tax=Chryseosolibacter indicus TaxID=2782351 RepID=A0ABS5VX56_9BACT|nr:hypothetical protein [Chryseosolibacter indicus]MBT1705319.1 hypothetical protein [Chryseosolibacter indicus]